MTGRNAISVSLLMLIVGFALSREFGIETGMAPVICVAFLVWAALEWRDMALIAKLTFLVALGFGLIVAFTGGLSPEVLELAIGRSAFFTFFLVSMDILRSAAMTSRMVLVSGKTIVSQPPGRRYAMITIGGHLFAILLNLGAISLLGAMNRRSIEDNPEGADPRIQDVRLRRMTLALVRGFTAFTMWSPTAVTMIVLMAAIPGLDWYQFAPVGFLTIVLYLTLGWALDRVSYPRRPQQKQTQPLVQVLKVLAPMSILTVVILASAVLFSWLTGVRLIGALFICVPIYGFGWICVQYSRAGPITSLRLGQRRTVRKILPALVTMRSEISILSSAGFIAAVLPLQIDTQALGHFISGLGLTEGWLLVALMWFVSLTAPLGLNPIISVAVSIEVFARLSGFDFNPYLLALGGALAWGMATGMSPLGATIRLSARAVDRDPFKVGLIWNLPFSAIVLVTSSILLLILN